MGKPHPIPAKRATAVPPGRGSSQSLPTHDATLLLDEKWRILSANSRASQMFDARDQTLLGRRLGELVCADDESKLSSALDDLGLNGSVRLELRFRGQSEQIPAEFSAAWFEHSGLRAVQCNIHDLRHRKRNQQQLRRAALHDPLTDLPNRTFLLSRLNQGLASDAEMVLMLFDLGSFRLVSATLGHRVGDLLLISVVTRLRDAVSSPVFMARIEADLFAALLPGVGLASAAVEAIQAALAAPVSVGPETIYLTPCFGLASRRADHTTADEWLRDADLARSEAKSSESRTRWFKPDMDRRIRERLQIEMQFRRALEQDDLVLHYQPIVDLRSGRLVEFEALVRWRHAERGLLEPAAFLPHAERAGLTLALDQQVLAKACRQMHKWRRRFRDGPLERMSINVSCDYFAAAQFAEEVIAALDESGLEPERLRLEITEGAMFSNPERVPKVLERLRSIGVKISLDDFGTGYSSLSYLQRFPVDGLKIDRSFVSDTHQQHAILASVVGLGRALRMQVTAEGIASPMEYAIVQTLGCDSGQGFFFSPPLDAADAEALLDENPSWAEFD